jgi:RES domain-containing protein
MPEAWRIVGEPHAADAFDGEGARINGGRWNRPGTPAVYTAGNRALAALEMLVHIDRAAPLRFVLIRVSFAMRLLRTLYPSPPDPALRSPVIQPATREAGEAWLAAGTSPVLKVPSAIIPEETNYLLNPRHPRFGEIEFGPPSPFAFDPRLP